MGFLRPVEMAKVGVIGLKEEQERLLTVLHDLGVVQIEPIGPETLALVEPERASDVQRAIGDQLVRFRGLASALPPKPIGLARGISPAARTCSTPPGRSLSTMTSAG